MKFYIKRLLSDYNKHSKFLTGMALLLAVVTIPAVAIAGFGPNGSDRQVFDYKNTSQNGGAFDGPRFNSFINTDVYGDERAFLDTKECVVNGVECYSQGPTGGYKDVQTVTPGKEYLVRAYIHNDANPSINDDMSKTGDMDGIGVAKNTRVRFELPTGVANGFTAQARITADNSLPNEVYDTVDFVNDNQAYGISFVPGSAYIFNASHPDGLKLSDEIVGANGTKIGTKDMDGQYPGCFEYSSFVVIRVVVNTPKLEIEKFVSKDSMPTMSQSSESVTVKRGDTVSWRINYKNSGTEVAQNILVRDELPKGLEIIPESVVLSTAAGNETLIDTALGSGGVDVGDYLPEGNGVIRFSTKVNTDPNVCELKNIAFARATEIDEISDDAKVIISDCAPKVAVCETLTADKLSLKVGEKSNLTAKANATNGATIDGYIFTVNGTEVQNSDKATYVYTASKVGAYQISVAAKTSEGNKTNENCVKIVDVVKVDAPIYRCDSFTLSKNKVIIGERFTATVRVTAKNGATFKMATFTFGDEATDKDKLVTNKIKDGIITAEHSYAKVGDYAPRVKIEFTDKEGKLVSVENPACAGQVKVSEVKGTTTTLPDTGAGSVAGIMVAITAIGASLHRRFTLSRN